MAHRRHPPDAPTTPLRRGGAKPPSAPASGAPLHTEILPGERPDPRPDGAAVHHAAGAYDDGSHRYAYQQRLGAGGMGEVHACEDLRLRRQVAVKRLHMRYRNDAALRERFLREARIQARLEHPAIVPLHDLGQADGLPYFAMKRVQGVTLQGVLSALAEGDPEMRARYRRHKLLTALHAVMRAIEYAHAHGVVHRDLKPSNIMLGDFGEVYVIDWGISKELATIDLPTDPSRPRPAPEMTEAGAMLGTPGYIPPEQLTDETGNGSAAGDVYALGAILFELLTLQPLNPGDNAEARIHATVLGGDLRARAQRAMPDLAPELISLCERATATDPAARYADAGQLADALDRVLEGERDEALRRRLAAAQGEQAAAEAAQACASGGLPARRAAMEKVGRALALDPHNQVALGALLQLLNEPPAEVPEEVRALVTADRSRDIRSQLPFNALSYGAMLAFLPVAWWMGVHNWTVIAALTTLVMASVLSTLAVGRLWPASERGLYPALLASSLVVAGTSVFFGPLIAVPGMAAVNGVAYLVQMRGSRAYAVLLLSALAFLLPAGLQLAGVLPASYAFDGGGMSIHPWVVDIREVPALLFLALSGVGLVITPALSFMKYGRTLDRSREQLHLSGWQLRQLLPQVAQRLIA